LRSDPQETFIGIDVGGTFTDVILYNASSKETRVIKVSTSPRKIEEAIIGALSSEGIDPSRTKMMSHATTTATNALLTSSSLAKTALVTNVGFRDVLEIGRQRRPEIYNLYSKRPTPLVKRHDRYTIKGRMLYDGKELEPVQKKEVQRLARKLTQEKYDCVVVGLLNSYANPSHEIAVEKILARQYPGRIITSSSVNNEYREYERFSTAVVNAALIPLVSNYLDNLRKSLNTKGFIAPIYIMNSDGNVSSLVQASKFPISIIESGPAAGVLACADLAKSLSILKVATFDMGGTTAKAGMITNYQPDISYEFEASGSTHSGRSIKGSGYPVRYPFVDLAEVSSGGGTIAWVDDGGALRLGPKSAGAEPGPAAYGRGGVHPTITDANIILGRLSPVHLLGGKMSVHPELAMKAILEHVAEKLALTASEASHAIIRLVNHNMARAISIVSVERGRDPREYTLVSFGGAGPLHACDLAEEMSIRKVIVPLHPGLFSAYGLLTVDLARMFSIPVMSTNLQSLDTVFHKLRKDCTDVLLSEKLDNFILHESVDLRYQGQSFEINLPYQSPDVLRNLFDSKHRELYGYSSPDANVEVVNAKIKAVVPVPKIERKREEIVAKSIPRENGNREAWVSGKDSIVPVYVREELSPGNSGVGPAIVEEYDSTTVINSSWSWFIDEYRNIRLERT